MQFQLQGTLTDQDSHHYISHKFEVPQDATRLDIEFQYSPKRVGNFANLLTLSLFDPQVERGTGHRGQANQHITLSAGEATPGYVPGPLPSGTWDIMINANLINPGATVSYHFDISIGIDPQPEAVVWQKGKTNPRGKGWYCGDLHGHTFHSDGSWNAADFVKFARAQHLDFVTLTDHNTVSGLPEMDSFSADDLLTMGGFELTTFYGHCLALGRHEMLDWRVRPGERTLPQIMAQIEAAGGLFVIAHPMSDGDPICTGCKWEYADVMPGQAGIVEVWNEHWDSVSHNEEAVQLWYQWLNQGHHLYVTSGTDLHGAPDPALKFGFNMVYAEALTEAAILHGIRQGHSYISSGPQLTFTAQAPSGNTVMMGDSIDGAGCQLTARWEGCNDTDLVRLIVDGQVLDTITAKTKGEHTYGSFDSTKHWCVVEIRDEQGNMRALTNPIFTGATS